MTAGEAMLVGQCGAQRTPDICPECETPRVVLRICVSKCKTDMTEQMMTGLPREEDPVRASLFS